MDKVLVVIVALMYRPDWVMAAELLTNTTIPVCPYKEGQLLRGKGSAYFILQGCTLRPLPDFDIHAIERGDVSRAKVIPSELLHKIPIGEPISVNETRFERHHHLSGAEVAVVEYKLRTIQAKINESKPTCYNNGWLFTKDEYLRNKWSSQLEGTPALVYPQCFDTTSLGNTLGYYLNEVACAMMTGTHFIGVGKLFGLPRLDIGDHALAHYTFFEAFPDIIVNRSPGTLESIPKKLKEECSPNRYPWDNPKAPWSKRIPLLRHLLRRALKAMLEKVDISGGTTFLNGTDMIALPGDTAATTLPKSPLPFLPFVPDVAIQYRCSDNLPFGRLGYGLLPFRAFPPRIPASSKFIYISTEHPNRTYSQPYCMNIVHSLVDYIHKKFPNSTVLLKRTADPFLDFASLAYANTSICSASTFCIWPAIASNGSAHFPLTALVMQTCGIAHNLSRIMHGKQADDSLVTRENAPHLGPNFNWIFETFIIAGKLRASPQLLNTLLEEKK